MFGVYIHVPFCTSRCDYCAFATWDDRAHLIEEYLRACQRQVAAVSTSLGEITSVFVGGGTPNLVPTEALLGVLRELPLSGEAATEITVECNPDLVTAAQMAELSAGGVNRISLGVQSMVPAVLESLGREHDPAAVYRAVEHVRAVGISQLNLDLIYGANGESLADWERSLSLALELKPDHISAYGLTVEPGTPLAQDRFRWPDDDDQADKYLLADEMLAAAGFENYEISNWARPNSRCQHNLLYWSQGNYLGLGAAAHSHCNGRRWWNVRTPERFIAAVNNSPGQSTGLLSEARPAGQVEAGSEQLSAEQRRVERLQLELRTAWGIAAQDMPEDLPAEISELLVPGESGRVRLSLKGRLLANEVALYLK